MAEINGLLARPVILWGETGRCKKQTWISQNKRGMIKVADKSTKAGKKNILYSFFLFRSEPFYALYINMLSTKHHSFKN